MTYALLVYALLVALFPKRIRDPFDGAPYLTRYFLLRSPWLNVFLHHIHSADKDRHMHNHPWSWSWSIILRGGYLEERLPRAERMYWPWQKNTLTTAAYHRIKYVRPNTWTLFVAGRYEKSWGFLVDGVHVDSETYLEDTEHGRYRPPVPPSPPPGR